MSAEQSSTQPDPNANPATDPAREGNQFAQSLSASMGANMRRTANGDVDILHAIGGWRGLVESSLPAVAFLVLFTVTKELNLSLIAALAAAGVFTLIRLVQGSKLVSALTGLVGVAICAFAAYRTGNASDYFGGGLLDERRVHSGVPAVDAGALAADGSDFRGHSWRGVELASEPGASAPVHAGHLDYYRADDAAPCRAGALYLRIMWRRWARPA